MVNLNCNLSYQDLLNQFNFGTAEGFENEDFNAAFYSDWDQGAYTIKLYNGATVSDWSKYYIGKGMVIEDFFTFEPGFAEFEVWDYHPTQFNLPFYPPQHMKIVINNKTDNQNYFVGRVNYVQPLHITGRGNTNTDQRRFKFHCYDLKIDFHRNLESEVYPTAVTTYSVMKDVITRFTPFDGSNIDETKGFSMAAYQFSFKTPAQVLQEMLDIEITSTLYLNPETLEIFVGEKHQGTFSFLSLEDSKTDPNFVYKYTKPGEFFIAKENQTLRNRVHFFYNRKYAEGTVNVNQGNDHIIGSGTTWLTRVKPEGANFQIENGTAVYSVNNINSDTDITLGQAYQETTASGLNYSITGYRDYIVVDDGDNIATLAAVLGETGSKAGVWEMIMPNFQNPLTQDQALQYATAYLNRLSGDVILRGQMVTCNARANINPQAGQTVNMNLTQRYNVNLYAVCQKIRFEHDKGGVVDRNDTNSEYYDGSGRIDPWHRIVLDFTDRRLYNEKAIERVLQQQSDVKVVSSDEVFAVKGARENILLSDCVGVVDNIGPYGDDAEEITLSDTVSQSEVNPGGAYYTAPVGVGQNEAYTLGTGVYSFTS